MMITKFAKEVLSRKNIVLGVQRNIEDIQKLIDTLHPVTPPSGFVRIGPDNDGGYLVPNDLKGIKSCYSPGVGKTSDFEKECLEMGMTVHMADASVKSTLEQTNNCTFISKFLSSFNDGNNLTLKSWLERNNESNNQEDLMLQMDIEGSEYEVLIHSTEELLNRFRIIIIEFHSIQRLWDRFSYRLIERAFRKILDTHRCVHIHPNNHSGIDRRCGISIPRVAEFTFLRKDRFKESPKYRYDFPHPLDRDNSHEKSIVLPENWYSTTE